MTKPTATTDHAVPPRKRKTARMAPWRDRASSYDFIYTSSEDTKLDVIRPGFFNEYRSELIIGTMIECRLGDPQDGTHRVSLQVIDTTPYDTGSDVLVSVGDKNGHFTPVRLAGILEEEAA